MEFRSVLQKSLQGKVQLQFALNLILLNLLYWGYQIKKYFHFFLFISTTKNTLSIHLHILLCLHIGLLSIKSVFYETTLKCQNDEIKGATQLSGHPIVKIMWPPPQHPCSQRHQLYLFLSAKQQDLFLR